MILPTHNYDFHFNVLHHTGNINARRLSISWNMSSDAILYNSTLFKINYAAE